MSSAPIASAVLWDLDGTLVDTEQYWMKGESALAARYPGNWTHQDGLALVGLSLYESTRIMQERMQITDLSVDQIIDELTHVVMSELAREVPWRPGALELVRQLHLQGVRQVIVTMSMRRMALVVQQAVHDQTGLQVFDFVVAGDDVVNGKPHPEAYLKAAEQLGLTPQECVAFEDSINGLTSAEAAGTRAVGVPNVIDLPPAPGRVIWPTLLGVEPHHLNQLFQPASGSETQGH
jgi:HAD superfamily hydrolase (TIGR01509 family)